MGILVGTNGLENLVPKVFSIILKFLLFNKKVKEPTKPMDETN